MQRKYNHNISLRANLSLAKREAQLRTRKRLLAIALLILLIMGILFGIKVPVLAGKEENGTVQKYYKTICIEAGDTLWDIAGEYMTDSNMTRQEYVDAICTLNDIEVDEIVAGDQLIVMYYVWSGETANRKTR